MGWPPLYIWTSACCLCLELVPSRWMSNDSRHIQILNLEGMVIDAVTLHSSSTRSGVWQLLMIVRSCPRCSYPVNRINITAFRRSWSFRFSALYQQHEDWFLIDLGTIHISKYAAFPRLLENSRQIIKKFKLLFKLASLHEDSILKSRISNLTLLIPFQNTRIS